MITEKRTIYKCAFCGREYTKEALCKKHIEEEKKYRQITSDWKKGKSLGQLNKKYKFLPCLSPKMRAFSRKDGYIITYQDNPVLPKSKVEILRWEYKRVYIQITPLEENTFFNKPLKRYIKTEQILIKIQNFLQNNTR